MRIAVRPPHWCENGAIDVATAARAHGGTAMTKYCRFKQYKITEMIDESYHFLFKVEYFLQISIWKYHHCSL